MRRNCRALWFLDLQLPTVEQGSCAVSGRCVAFFRVVVAPLRVHGTPRVGNIREKLKVIVDVRFAVKYKAEGQIDWAVFIQFYKLDAHTADEVADGSCGEDRYQRADADAGFLRRGGEWRARGPVVLFPWR